MDLTREHLRVYQARTPQNPSPPLHPKKSFDKYHLVGMEAYVRGLLTFCSFFKCTISSTHTVLTLIFS